MLTLSNIVKDYPTGDATVRALDGISLNFRKSELVSILGPSGCGKTTLLNIIGGLDQYTSGDLSVNGVSTKEYKDANWDAYRNHSVGFVFQSYNLIPHQTVLANVELALTLSGVSKSERRKRAIDALEQVGLGDQIHKKPNQMSGGQMQRVAIARALVNNPEILLADEPTGALDTQTSIQIMNILQEVAKSRLIIMVTHNPELAQTYSTRIIKLLDGRVIDDSDPFEGYGEKEPQESVDKKHAKANIKKNKLKSMSFFTALSLSLNNLMTKKARTFMTSFAGSIGIIGIALILSVSTGVNSYINAVQRETLASYPIQLDSQTADLTSMVSSLMEAREDSQVADHDLDKVYESVVLAKMMNAMGSIETKTNDLASFKKQLEGNPEYEKYLSGIQYAYNFNWSIFVRERNEISEEPGRVVKSDVMGWLSNLSTGSSSSYSSLGSSSMMGSSFQVWQELLAPINGDGESLVNSVITEQYELIDEGGRWPEAANEVVLIVNENNEISDLALFALGLRTESEMNQGLMAGFGGGEKLDLSDRKSWTYEEIKQMKFRLLLASECYEQNLDGSYSDLSETTEGRNQLYNNEDLGFTLKVVGIIRAKEESTSNFLTGAIGYTSELAKEALNRTQTSELLKKQKEDTENDVIAGLPFKPLQEKTTEEKRQAISDYLSSLSDEEKQRAFLYPFIQNEVTQTQIATEYQALNGMQNDILAGIVQSALNEYGTTTMTAESVLGNETRRQTVLTMIAKGIAQQKQNNSDFGSTSVADLVNNLTEAQITTLYESENFPHDYSDTTYAKNLYKLGDVDMENPATIYLYASTFENKDEISRLIGEYNDSVDEDKKIEYTDYVALLMSSITTIINAISYVLIAFVAISLIVSSIMIGIITYISVLERTKEIGILRSIGASKKDVRRVFNAETLIVGFAAGVIGIVSTLLLNIVINIILFSLTGIVNLKAILPWQGALILVLISMSLTLIAGLFPAGFAARRNPVEALRTE